MERTTVTLVSLFLEMTKYKMNMTVWMKQLEQPHYR